MKLILRNSDSSTWLLLAKIGDKVILRSYINDDEYCLEDTSNAKQYSLVKDLKPFKYWQKVLVSNDNVNRYEKEFVMYLPERNKYLCRPENQKIYFQRKYCKWITTSDEEPIQTT